MIKVEPPEDFLLYKFTNLKHLVLAKGAGFAIMKNNARNLETLVLGKEHFYSDVVTVWTFPYRLPKLKTLKLDCKETDVLKLALVACKSTLEHLIFSAKVSEESLTPLRLEKLTHLVYYDAKARVYNYSYC